MGVEISEQCFPEASSLVHPHTNPCCSDSGEDSIVDQESEASSSVTQCLGFESETGLSTTLSSSDYDLLYETIEGSHRIECKKERRRKRKLCRSGCNKNSAEKRRENVSGGRRACDCAASFAADCAAICCCPCALLHLFILAFVKAPSVFVRKALCFAKKKARSSRKSDHNKKNNDDDESDDDNRQKSRYYTPPWSPQTSGPSDGSFAAKLESQKIWSEFYAAGHMGFGGLPFEWN